VIVPTRGDAERLRTLLPALDGQTYPRERHEVLLSFDGAAPDAALTSDIARRGWHAVVEPRRAGPGAARNRGARDARGAYLAFTEDDCVPEPSWLEEAARRMASDPSIDVLVGDTLLPDGSQARRPADRPHYLPTNLFVRRLLFEQIGGYHEGFFDASSGIYFREDSDLGFSLEAAGAVIGLEPSARVVHPREHPRALDPIRWARRYEMDALLQKRHPERFRGRIEIHRIGPFTIRRLFVRMCFAVVIASVAAATAWACGAPGVAAFLGVLAFAAFLPLWGKWGCSLRHLPAVLAVPWVLVASMVRGWTLRRA
jgi:glycosyltransferase involved in cell wall biosynthesis